MGISTGMISRTINLSKRPSVRIGRRKLLWVLIIASIVLYTYIIFFSIVNLWTGKVAVHSVYFYLAKPRFDDRSKPSSQPKIGLPTVSKANFPAIVLVGQA